MFKHLNTTEEMIKHMEENIETNTTQEFLYKNDTFLVVHKSNSVSLVDSESEPSGLKIHEMNLDQIKEFKGGGYTCNFNLFENCFVETIKERTSDEKIIKKVKYKISFKDNSTLEVHFITPQ